MNLERYDYSMSKSCLDFEFESEGPKGKIKKIVTYSPQNAGGTTYFHLAFGDWDKVKNRLDDKAISNNRDTDRILATVAATVIEFTGHFPDMPVYARGSSRARTRLYQIAISGNWNEIRIFLDVYGFNGVEWERFVSNVNYEAFFAYRKQN